MTGVEIFLIFVGIITVVCSFIFAERLEKNDGKSNENVTAINEEMVRKKVDEAIDAALDDKVEDTEAKMDKISNEKILAMGDYYKTVSDEITQNHSEVMFLYGMLNDKEKDIKNTVRDVENLKKSIVQMKSEEKEAEDKTKESNEKENSNMVAENMADAQTEPVSYEKNTEKHPVETKNNSDSTNGNDEVDKRSVALSKKDAKKKTNNNDMILKMYNSGKSNIEIAKELKIGMGEVRLVIDLYKNRGDKNEI